MGTFLGVPIIRITEHWGLFWGPPVLGNYHIHPQNSACSDGASARSPLLLERRPSWQLLALGSPEFSAVAAGTCQ